MKYKKHLMFMMFMIITILSVTSVYAQETGNAALVPAARVVRVGFPMQDGLTQKDENGTYSGYTYDYLQEIAQYTGWEYEFVEIPGDINESLMTMMDMLQKGELDILGAMVKNEQTEELFDFPEYSYGLSYTTLSLPEENTFIHGNNYQAIEGLRIATREQAENTNKSLKSFCEANNVDYELVFCESNGDVVDAVLEGRADVMVSNDIAAPGGFRTIAQFNGNVFYFGVTKGNSEILNELNRTILTIKQIKPSFDSQLYEKYFLNRSYTTILSEEEKQFVQKAKPLRVAMITSNAPISFQEESGECRGITHTVLERITKETGLKFEYIPVSGYEQAYELLEQNEVDAVCGIPYNYRLAQEHSMILSNALLTAQMVLVTPNDKEFLGPCENTGAIADMVDIKNLQVMEYDSVEACLDAVKKGEVGCAYLNLYSAEYFSQQSKYKNMRLIAQDDKSVELCLGIKKPVDSNLISIINKVLANISSADMETIIYQNTSNLTKNMNLEDFISANPLMFASVIGFIFVLLLGISLWIMQMRIKASQQLDLENKRYLQLCELSNEYLYEYNCKKDLITFSKSFAELFKLPEKIEQFMEVIQGNSQTEIVLNPAVFTIFQKLFFHKDEMEFEQLCRLPSGEQRWLRDVQAEIKDKDGTVIYMIGKLVDVQVEREEKEKLERQALLDGLTGIYNAVTVKRIIAERLRGLRRQGALLIIDIDKFKEVNDTLGHYIGDRVLMDFAAMLTSIVEQWDIVGRLGGDEFIVFLDYMENEGALASFCDMMCHKANKEYHSGTEAVRMITISVGAVIIAEESEFDHLYQAADKLLYQSKENGRNGYTIETI